MNACYTLYVQCTCIIIVSGDAKTDNKTAAITITVLTLLVIVIFLLAYKMYHDRSDVNSAIRRFQVTPNKNNTKEHGLTRKLPNATKIKTTNEMERPVNLSYSTMKGASQADERGEKREVSSYYPTANPQTNVMDSGPQEAKKKKKRRRRKYKK